MNRKASAVWEGDLKSGKGSVSTESGALKQTQYSFSTRFENGVGTNPEELIAAAHAGCFSMALSAGLGKAGTPPKRVHTTAKLNFEKTAAGFSVTRIDLTTEADVPGIEEAAFHQQAEDAKRNCPISRLLAPGTEITLSAKLVR